MRNLNTVKYQFYRGHASIALVVSKAEGTDLSREPSQMTCNDRDPMLLLMVHDALGGDRSC